MLLPRRRYEGEKDGFCRAVAGRWRRYSKAASSFESPPSWLYAFSSRNALSQEARQSHTRMHHGHSVVALDYHTAAIEAKVARAVSKRDQPCDKHLPSPEAHAQSTPRESLAAKPGSGMLGPFNPSHTANLDVVLTERLARANLLVMDPPAPRLLACL